MKLSVITVPLIALTLVSCDKVKSLAEKAKSTVASEVAKKAGESANTKADPELQKLVDHSPEGTLFRKDLPFPNNISVKINQRSEVSGRFSQKSELGSQVDVLKGTITTTTKVERSGDRVSYTMLESIFTEPVIEGEASKDKPAPKVLETPSAPYEFVKSGSTWKSAIPTDFRIVSRAQAIAPFFDQLLIENALAPRKLWFGKKRFKIGEEMLIADDFMPVLIPGKVAGKLKLKLEALEAVHGHPCGVFSVSGNFTRKQFPSFSGVVTNEDVTVESGKLWLSLLYPLVLREELQMIQSANSGGQGGLSTSGSGSAKVSVIREWKGTQK
jgi:hypothetical protein